MTDIKRGDGESFDKNWREREEALYTHWTRDEPKNQIQLAFRNHWELFSELMKDPRYNGGKRVLEVGCGRGSLSCYFSDAGYDCTLLDLSPKVIDIAKTIFEKNQLRANFLVGDVSGLPFEDQSFDMTFSIGLWEHFEELEAPLKEQIRILDHGGLFLGYVVPEYTHNVQNEYQWINEIIKGYAHNQPEMQVAKEAVFRSDLDSSRYLPILEKYGLEALQASGVYPMPMISHSIDFPFSLMPAASELAFVEYLKKLLQANGAKTGKHPWLCEEGRGQAFLIWGFKP